LNFGYRFSCKTKSLRFHRENASSNLPQSTDRKRGLVDHCLSIIIEGVEITQRQELEDLMSVITITNEMTSGQFSDPSEAVPKVARGAQAQLSGEKVPVNCRNFTWEHFFTDKCGVRLEDALKYEKNLIAHRMNPKDTLCESMTLRISVGPIAVGDKLKIVKTIQRQEQDLARIGAVSRLRNAGNFMPSEKKVDFEAIGASVANMNDPALRLLRSFEYETFDYTKDKEIGECAIPPPWAEAQVQDLLFGQHRDRQEARDPESVNAALNAAFQSLRRA
jgi:hypothetical protein